MKKNLKNLYRRWRKLDKFERRELRVWLYQGIGFLLLTTVCPVFIVNSVYTFCIFMLICQKAGRLRFERYYSILHIRMYDRLEKIHGKNVDALNKYMAETLTKMEKTIMSQRQQILNLMNERKCGNSSVPADVSSSV